MKTNDLPDVKQKQKLLYSKETSKNTLINQGKQFLDVEWYTDAVDFFEKAGYKKGLVEVRKCVSKQGDAFLLKYVLRAMNEQADPDEWNKLGSTALRLGKLQFAREGYRVAGNSKSIHEVEQMINPSIEREK